MLNLKDAFRYQNKLQSFIESVHAVLANSNVTTIKETEMRSEVMEGVKDEVNFVDPPIDYSDHINDMARFYVELLGEKEKLSRAVRDAKESLDIDIDSEVNLNSLRQSISNRFQKMMGIKETTKTIPNGGSGYRFKEDGEQVLYKCPLIRETSLNFDKDMIREMYAKINEKAEKISNEIDKAMVNTEVDYDPIFDANDTFYDAFEGYLAKIYEED